MHDKYAYKVIWSPEDEEYVGLCVEFPSLSWLSKSQEEAFSGIRTVVSDVIKDMQKAGEELPEPLMTKQFSGKFMVRVPPELHRQLAMAAQEAHVSLNRLISAKLAA